MAINYAEDDFKIDDEGIEEGVYISYDIASYPSDYTLSGIAEMWERGDIEIPDFQREFVWSIRQSSLLIDSFLSGLPVPPVFFYVDRNSKNLVIDGQQRILSVVFFFEGYFGKESTQGKRQVFRLSGLGEGSPYERKRYEDLDESDQRKLRQAVLRAVNIRQISPDDDGTSAFYIFERLNTGGTPLRPQEIRNVVYRGELNRMLRNANNDKNWRKILGRPYLDKHQKDVEILLRVFSLVGAAKNYEKPMKQFLNKAMQEHRDGISPKAKTFFERFPRVTEGIVKAVGEKPFHLRGPINVSALDSVCSVLLEDLDRVDWNMIGRRYTSLRTDKDFGEHTSYNTTDSKTVAERMRIVRQYLLEQ